LLGLTIVVGTAASACGTSSDRSAADTVVVSAASSTSRAASFHASGQDKTVETDHPSVVENSSTMTALVDLARHSTKETDTATTPVSSQPMNSVPPGASPPLPSTETQTTITIGRSMWMSAPYTSGVSGAHWTYLSVPSCVPTAWLGPFGDPAQIFTRLAAGLHDVTKVGTETVGGVSADHYTGTATWPLPSYISKSGEKADVKIDVWVDSKGLVRQLSTVSHMPAVSMDTPSVPAETDYSTIRFFDFGSPVIIQAPPPNQITTVPNTLNLLHSCQASYQ
jgi:hypothetical protein